jgi:hypothetical protein
MSQTKSGSLGEALSNTGSAIVLSLLSYQFLGPAIGWDVTYADNLIVTGYFTVLSFMRIYVIRRVTLWWRQRRKDAYL